MLSVGSSSVYSLFSLLSITSSLGSSSITDESDVFSSLLISEENIQEITEPIIENQEVDNNEADNS